MNPTQLERLFSILAKQFDFSTAEITSEANPSDLTAEKVGVLAELGVNRFSLGVQSFSESKLKFLERDHNAETIQRAVETIKQHVDNFSLDLIFATQDETLAQWQNDLDQSIALQPNHLSTYELTIEKGTQFWNRKQAGQKVQSHEDSRAAMYELAIDFLGKQKLAQYEISSFAREDYRCQHNLIYWSGEPYFAFGAGASRFIDGVRETNHGSVTNYIKRIMAGQSPVQETERLSPEQNAFERLVIGLRQVEGVDKSRFSTATGYQVDSLIKNIASQLLEHGLVRSTPEAIQLTQRGIMLYDSVATLILNR